MSQSKLKFTLGAAAVTALVTVSSVMAVTPPAKVAAQPGDTTSEAAPVAATAGAPQQLSPADVEMQKSAILAAAGRSTVEHLEASLQALEQGKVDQAKQYLQVANDTLGRINKALAGDGADLSSSVIPLFARVGVLEEVEFSAEQTRQLNALGPLVAAGEHDKVTASLSGMGVAMAYSYVEMPLAATTDAVAAAVSALDDGDKAGASAQLKSVEKMLVADTITVGASAAAADPSHG